MRSVKFPFIVIQKEGKKIKLTVEIYVINYIAYMAKPVNTSLKFYLKKKQKKTSFPLIMASFVTDFQTFKI